MIQSKYIPFILCSLVLSIGYAMHAHAYRWHTDLSPEQEAKAQQIINETAPKITAMRAALQEKIEKLKNFAYTSPTDHESLALLGEELQSERKALRDALIALDARLVQEVGVSLHGYRGRDCNSLANAREYKDPTFQKHSVATPHHTE